jgi:hypothetical protein
MIWTQNGGCWGGRSSHDNNNAAFAMPHVQPVAANFGTCEHNSIAVAHEQRRRRLTPRAPAQQQNGSAAKTQADDGLQAHVIATFPDALLATLPHTEPKAQLSDGSEVLCTDCACCKGRSNMILGDTSIDRLAVIHLRQISLNIVTVAA